MSQLNSAKVFVARIPVLRVWGQILSEHSHAAVNHKPVQYTKYVITYIVNSIIPKNNYPWSLCTLLKRLYPITTVLNLINLK